MFTNAGTAQFAFSSVSVRNAMMMDMEVQAAVDELSGGGKAGWQSVNLPAQWQTSSVLIALTEPVGVGGVLGAVKVCVKEQQSTPPQVSPPTTANPPNSKPPPPETVAPPPETMEPPPEKPDPRSDSDSDTVDGERAADSDDASAEDDSMTKGGTVDDDNDDTTTLVIVIVIVVVVVVILAGIGIVFVVRLMAPKDPNDSALNERRISADDRRFSMQSAESGYDRAPTMMSASPARSDDAYAAPPRSASQGGSPPSSESNTSYGAPPLGSNGYGAPPVSGRTDASETLDLPGLG